MDPHHGLNVLDYSVLGLILLSGLLALMRGFLREVFSLAAWVGAYFAAAKYFFLAVPWSHRYIKNETGAAALAAVIVFCATLTVLTLIGYLLARLIRGDALTAIDRSLGFLFGLLRGALIVCLVYLGATYIPWLNTDKFDQPEAPQLAPQWEDQAKMEEKEQEKPPEWLAEAKTRPALARGAKILKAFIPEKEIEKTMRKYEKEKDSARKVIDDRARDMMSVPGLEPKPQEKPPVSENRERLNLDQFIQQKSNP